MKDSYNNYREKSPSKLPSKLPSKMAEPMGHERDESNYEKAIGLKGSAKTKYVKEKIKYSKDMRSMYD
jgi:hypothetical protein